MAPSTTERRVDQSLRKIIDMFSVLDCDGAPLFRANRNTLIVPKPSATACYLRIACHKQGSTVPLEHVFHVGRSWAARRWCDHNLVPLTHVGLYLFARLQFGQPVHTWKKGVNEKGLQTLTFARVYGRGVQLVIADEEED